MYFYVLYGSQNKQLLIPYSALVGRFLYWRSVWVTGSYSSNL